MPPLPSERQRYIERVHGPDLDAVGRDLADVERALARLDDGTYWTDEVTGERIPDVVLERNPATRRTGAGVE